MVLDSWIVGEMVAMTTTFEDIVVERTSMWLRLERFAKKIDGLTDNWIDVKTAGRIARLIDVSIGKKIVNSTGVRIIAPTRVVNSEDSIEPTPWRVTIGMMAVRTPG